MGKKQKIVSVVLYGINLAVLFVPLIPVRGSRLSLIGLTLQLKSAGFRQNVIRSDSLVAAFKILSVSLILFGVLCVFYIATVLLEKGRRLNLVIYFLAVWIMMSNMGFGAYAAISDEQIIAYGFPIIFIITCAAEFISEKAMESWDELNREAREYQERERREKEEKKTRLAFAGKYSRLFYQVVWKNTRSTWRDYLLMLACSSMAFCFILTGVGMYRMLNRKHSVEGVLQLLGGLNSIFINALVPLCIVTIVIIVLLTIYYIRRRAKNYGIFLTLGMRRKTLNGFIAAEFLSLLVVTVLAGGLAGTALLRLFEMRFRSMLHLESDASSVGIATWSASVGVLLLIFLVAFMAARDIFQEFQMGRNADLEAIREKMPVRRRKVFIALGAVLSALCAWEYSRLRNFESVSLIAVFFAGVFLILRYGMAEWLSGERKKRTYLRKLLLHNQIFFKSRSAAGYIFGMVLILFCALFYFPLQTASVRIAETEDVLFPYDIMCLADREDGTVFEKLKEKYGAELSEYPMLRISNYDSTELPEAEGMQPPPPQGQHIGISESTCHELKKRLDPSYRAEPLGLDEAGKKIYIVHQQDKSVKAQPVDFFPMRRHPILHIGKPIPTSLMFLKDEGWYEAKDIAGEEIGSLTGAFRQGLRENLIVYSDAYFAKVYEENPADGPTRLILIRADARKLPDIVSELSGFRERHESERSYDASVQNCYTKDDAISDLRTERTMKTVMNTMLMVVFFVIYIILLGIRMLTGADQAKKRMQFFVCMGMPRQERKRLARRELSFYYYILPTIAAFLLTLLFTALVFTARQYTSEDILRCLRHLAVMWGICLIAAGAAVNAMLTLYVRKVVAE